MSSLRSRNSLKSFDVLTVGDRAYAYYSLKAAEQTLGDLSHLPCCLRILLENLLRHEDDAVVTVEDMRSLSAFHALRKNPPTLSFRPSRLLMEDETAVSVLTDLAAMREAQIRHKDDPSLLVPACPTTIVVTGSGEITEKRRVERLSFLRWGEQAFKNISVLPPGKGSSCVLNASFLTSLVQIDHASDSQTPLVYPDTALGENPRLSLAGALGSLVLPSTPMDLESILLDSPLSFALPGVLGVKISGKKPKNVDSTDIALGLLKAVRQNGGAGKMVEFFGPGLDHLTVPDRMVIADLLAEAGVVSVFFPIDALTIAHLSATGVDIGHIALVEAYAKAQGLWRESWPHDAQQARSFTASFDFTLDPLKQNLGGPGLAFNPLNLSEAAASFLSAFPSPEASRDPLAMVHHGDVVWASIGPSGAALNPTDLALAGLLARKALSHGMKIKPWVRAVLNVPHPLLQDFLTQTGLGADLEALGFHRQSSPISTPPAPQETVAATVARSKLAVCGLSTSPEFPSLCAAQYLASPALIVAYALAGQMGLDLTGKTFAQDAAGKNLTLKELWPSATELAAFLEASSVASLYQKHKAALLEGSGDWRRLEIESGPLFPWKNGSLLIKRPSMLENFGLSLQKPENIVGAKILSLFGSDVPAEAIAPPAGPIPPDSATARLLVEKGETAEDLGSFGERTGNEDVMLRASFGATSGATSFGEKGEPLFETAALMRQSKTPLLLAAGQNFGRGTSGQEWAAKAAHLMGVFGVIAESYAPSFRLNLVRVGILPLQLKTGVSLSDLKLDGKETINIAGISDFIRPPVEVMVTINHPDDVDRYMLRCRLDTEEEMETWRHGSLWAEALRNLIMLAA